MPLFLPSVADVHAKWVDSDPGEELAADATEFDTAEFVAHHDLAATFVWSEHTGWWCGRFVRDGSGDFTDAWLPASAEPVQHQIGLFVQGRIATDPDTPLREYATGVGVEVIEKLARGLCEVDPTDIMPVCADCAARSERESES
ncbi:MAG: hypothetical protein L0K41_02720 [Yaniella sp.]|nr:hypothetical protein [Yaniella sp.]